MSLRVCAVVPSAGYGRRLGLKTKKPFVLLKGVPIILRTLKKLDNSALIDNIIVASERSCIDRIKRLVKSAKLKKVASIIAGGATRLESVANCLNVIDDSYDIILIHDGARPFVEEEMIRSSIEMACKHGASIVAVKESDTVKVSDRALFIRKTLDRTHIFRAQTPQTFKASLIKKAYRIRSSSSITDDASLVEGLGRKVKIVEGSHRNIKITTKEDLAWAEAML